MLYQQYGPIEILKFQGGRVLIKYHRSLNEVFFIEIEDGITRSWTKYYGGNHVYPEPVPFNRHHPRRRRSTDPYK